MKQQKGAGWVELVLALCTLIVLVATPLYLFVQPGFVESQYRRESFPASDRFSAEERMRLSRTLVNYLLHRASAEEMAALRTDTGEPALRPSELSHMADVRRVMDGFFWAHGLALAILVLLGIFLVRGRQGPVLLRGLRRGVLLTVGLMVLILVSATLDFDHFFTVFHSLFFRSGTWVFYAEDTLIQLYPLPFWITAVTAFAITIVVEAAAVWMVSWLIERRGRRAA
ncbi:MAG: TIGR01906 family membrane protein [Anaerolineales bacterium]